MSKAAFIDRIQAAPLQGGFRMDDHWVWCGSVIKGPDGLYHMFASIWSKDIPFAPNWVTSSRIVRATSTTPEGPYHYVEDVLAPREPEAWDGKMTHNPTIHEHEGTYLLFYTGSTYQADMPNKEHPNVSEELYKEARQNQRIGLATAPSPTGPWKRYDQAILEPRPGHWDSFMTTNPAPCVRPDGSILLLYKSTSRHRTKIQYGVAHAQQAHGPYERLSEEPIFKGDISYEDAYIWFEDGRHHMLFKDMSEHFCDEKDAGAYATSIDGVQWQVAANPKGYSKKVLWDDGSITQQGSFERPQLLIENGKPTHLFAATSDGTEGFWDAQNTWNMVRPLTH